MGEQASSYAGTRLDDCCSYEWLKLDPHWSSGALKCLDTRQGSVTNIASGAQQPLVYKCGLLSLSLK